MNLISKTTSAIIHPVRTATSVADHGIGLAAAGAKTTMRLLDRAAGQVRGGDRPGAWSSADSATDSVRTPGATETSATLDTTLVEPEARKAPAKRAPAKKAPSARAATVAPALSQTEAEATTGPDDVRTPSGIPAADEGYNPDTAETDLHQPGTEPLMDPATVKSVKSEADVMQRAADPDKG